MARPILNRCCCWNNTRDGSLAVGWLFMIFSLLGLISYSISLAQFDNLKQLIMNMMNNPASFTGTDENVEIPEETKQQVNLILSILKGCLIYELVVVLLYVLVTALLLYGVHKNKRFFLMPWILWTSLNVGIGIILLIVVMVVGIAAVGWPVIIGGLVSLAFMAFFIYCILCVISQYQKLRDETVDTENMTKLY